MAGYFYESAVFIFLHSHKNCSILFDFLKFVALFKTGSFIRDCDWLQLCARVTSFSRLFGRARIYIYTHILICLLLQPDIIVVCTVSIETVQTTIMSLK